MIDINASCALTASRDTALKKYQHTKVVRSCPYREISPLQYMTDTRDFELKLKKSLITIGR